MNLSELKPAKGATKQRKRLGRGRASGHGKTSSRGHKGQKSRSGRKPRLGFEGGQMSILRRVPKLKGFKSINKIKYEIVNLDRLDVFTTTKVISPETMFEKGLIKKPTLKVKVLGDGKVNKAFKVQAHAFSKIAKEKIEAAGGEAKVI